MCWLVVRIIYCDYFITRSINKTMRLSLKCCEYVYCRFDNKCHSNSNSNTTGKRTRHSTRTTMLKWCVRQLREREMMLECESICQNIVLPALLQRFITMELMKRVTCQMYQFRIFHLLAKPSHIAGGITHTIEIIVFNTFIWNLVCRFCWCDAIRHNAMDTMLASYRPLISVACRTMRKRRKKKCDVQFDLFPPMNLITDFQFEFGFSLCNDSMFSGSCLEATRQIYMVGIACAVCMSCWVID